MYIYNPDDKEADENDWDTPEAKNCGYSLGTPTYQGGNPDFQKQKVEILDIKKQAYFKLRFDEDGGNDYSFRINFRNVVTSSEKVISGLVSGSKGKAWSTIDVAGDGTQAAFEVAKHVMAEEFTSNFKKDGNDEQYKITKMDKTKKDKWKEDPEGVFYLEVEFEREAKKDVNAKIKKGEKQKGKYSFYYFKDRKELYYTCTITYREDKDGKVLEVSKKDQKDYEDNKGSSFKVTASVKGSDKRKTVEFVDALEDTKYYENVGNIKSADAKKVEDKVSTILSAITSIGMVLSVLVPAILGVKYMLSSVEEKANYKAGIVPYIVGAVLVFGVCTIVKILQTIGTTINNS